MRGLTSLRSWCTAAAAACVTLGCATGRSWSPFPKPSEPTRTAAEAAATADAPRPASAFPVLEHDRATAGVAAAGEPQTVPAPETAAAPPADAEPALAPRVLTLEAAINRAVAANRTLLNARDRTETAELSIVQAKSAFELKVFPRGDLGATGEIDGGMGTTERMGAGLELRKQFTYGTVVTVEPSIQRTGDLYETGIEGTLLQPLLRGRNREFNLDRVDAAEFGQRSASRALYLTRVNTILATVNAVYVVVRQREFVRLNQESADRLRGHFEAAKVKEGIGITTAIDTYRAGLELKQAEDNLTNAQQGYEDALDTLRVLLALPLDDDLDVTAPLTYDPVTMEPDAAVRIALLTRVELDEAADAVRDLERQARVAKHRILPELNVGFSLARVGTGDSLGQSTDVNDNLYGVSLSTTTDLARTAERAEHQQRLVNLRTGRRALHLRRDQVAQEVRQELRGLERAGHRIDIQREQIRQAEGQLALARVKFDRGLASNFDVIDAESELRRAQLSLISVVVDYIIGTYRLRGALGTLVERPQRF